MELVYLERRNRCQNDGAAPEFSGRLEEDRHLSIASSELRSDLGQFGRKLPLVLDVKQSKICQSCRKKPCSCSGEVPHSDDYLPIPSKMMILEFLVKSLRHPRRTHNISDLDDLVSESSEKVVLDTIDALVNLKSLPKSPSLLIPGAKTRKIKSWSRSRTQSQILKLMSPEMDNTSSPGVSLHKRRLSEFSMNEKMFLSCSSTASMSSNQATSFSHNSLSAGLIQRVWKDGLPHFEFSADDPVDVYVANLVKVKSATDKALDYIYLFHSGAHGRKDSSKNSTNASKFVGKMKVSTSLILNSSESSCMETEFVLFGSSDDYSRQMENCSSSIPKSKGLAKRVAGMIRPSYLASPKHKSAKSCPLQFDYVNEAIEGELSGAKVSGATNLITDDFPTNHELTAIVVRDYRQKRTVKPVGGGWGLKFLGKATDKCEDTDMHSRNRAARHINVIVPRGYHGGPVTKDGCPWSLTDRWKSGGRCDCGGWDIGCPIRVLNNEHSSVPQVESLECKSVDLSVEGSKNGKPVLRLVNVTEDLYIIYSESSLSALQCFSTGIAIIHGQTPDLYPNL